LVGSAHTVSGLTTGHYLKATSATTFAFAAITWADVSGKPSTFTPSVHNHSATEITSGTLDNARLAFNPDYFVQGDNSRRYTIVNSANPISSFKKCTFFRMENTDPAFDTRMTSSIGLGFKVSNLNDYSFVLMGQAHGNGEVLFGGTDPTGALYPWRKIWHEGNFNPSDYYTKTKLQTSGSAQVHWNNIINRPYLSVLGTERTLSVTSEGWYTIATCSTGRAYGEFHVYDYDSSRHNFVKIIASTSYGQNNVSVLHGNKFGLQTVAHVRILYNTSDRIYGGAKLQVYCTNPTFTLYVRQCHSKDFSNWNAWNDVAPVLEGTPTGWAQDDITYTPNIAEAGLVLGGDHIKIRSITPISDPLSIKGDLFIWNKLYLIDRGGTAFEVIDRDAASAGNKAYLKNIDGLNSITVYDSGFSAAGTLSLSASTLLLNGNVGINKPTPQNKLHVHGTSSAFLQITTDSTGSSDAYDGFTIGVDSSGDRLIRTNYNKEITIQSESGTTPGSFVDICSFGLYNDQGTIPRTYFYGNVNIVGQITGGLVVSGETAITGNLSSTGNLTVDGTITSQSDIFGNNLKLESTNALLTIQPYSSGGIKISTSSSQFGPHAHYLARSSTSGTLKIIREYNGSMYDLMKFGIVYNEISAPVTFYTNRLQANGEVLSKGNYWSMAASDMFTIMPYGTDNQETYLIHNLYFDGAWKYCKNYGSSLIAFHTDGSIVMYCNPVGAADAIGPTLEAMRVSSTLAKISKPLFLPNLKSGTTQANAGAAAGEVWRRTTDNVLCIGV